MNDAITPYAGTSGWSGSDASRERAEDRDASGLTGKVQRQVHDYARNMGPGGVTVAELRWRFADQHHGTLSGALSILHKAGLLLRLPDKRGRCSIYVVPEHLGNREHLPPISRAKVEVPSVTLRATDGVNHIGWKIITAARDNGGTIQVTIL